VTIARAATIISNPPPPRLKNLSLTGAGFHQDLTNIGHIAAMPKAEQQVRLDEAFERIEETILPCIAMMLDTLIDASESVAENERRFLAAELKTLAAELEELTKAVERSSPAHVEPGEYKTSNVG
jgi:uncharacterized protein YfcZ (UPF0381/DUF406 family)